MAVRRLPGRSGYFADLAGSVGIVHAGDQRARNYIIGRHHHDVWELYLQLSGPATQWRVGAEAVAVGPGELLAVPPGVQHQMVEQASGAVHFMFAALDPGELLREHPDVAHYWQRTDHVLHSGCDDLVVPFEAFLRDVSYGRRWQQVSMRMTATLLLVEATRLIAGDARQSLALPHLIDQAVQALQADEAGELSLHDLAEQLHVSPGHLSARFTADVGVPPMTYGRHQRLERVKARLRDSDDSITTLAADFGFSSPQHLATSFRRYTGQTLGQYRASSATLAAPDAGNS